MLFRLLTTLALATAAVATNSGMNKTQWFLLKTTLSQNDSSVPESARFENLYLTSSKYPKLGPHVELTTNTTAALHFYIAHNHTLKNTEHDWNGCNDRTTKTMVSRINIVSDKSHYGFAPRLSLSRYIQHVFIKRGDGILVDNKTLLPVRGRDSADYVVCDRGNGRLKLYVRDKMLNGGLHAKKKSKRGCVHVELTKVWM